MSHAVAASCLRCVEYLIPQQPCAGGLCTAIAGYPADDGQCRRLWFATPCIRCVWESVRIRRSAGGAGLRRLCRSERWLWGRSACQWRPLLCAASVLGQRLLRNRRLGPGAILRLVSPRASGLSETGLLVAYLKSRRVGGFSAIYDAPASRGSGGRGPPGDRSWLLLSQVCAAALAGPHAAAAGRGLQPRARARSAAT